MTGPSKGERAPDAEADEAARQWRDLRVRTGAPRAVCESALAATRGNFEAAVRMVVRLGWAPP